MANRTAEGSVASEATGVDANPLAGLRPFELAFPGETKSLRWEDIDFEKRYIKVRAEVDGKNRTAVIVSKDLRDKKIITSWENDVMRHSFCSYLLAKEHNIGYVAEQAANSPEMIKKHYRQPLTQEEGEAWFEIRPKLAEDKAEVA